MTEHVARYGGELLRICPSLSTRVATTPAPTESDDATERFLAFEAAADLLRRIAAARPLVLMLDDLQWAEPTALLLLRHLARALADAPVLLVLSSRDPGEHASEALRLALADLDRGEPRRLQLVGLDGDELDDLVSATGSIADRPEPEQVVEALRAQTAGNPLYASQLIRHWTEAGFDRDTVPPSLRDVVWSRVNAIGADATDVLTAASVLGVEFYEDVLLDMVGAARIGRDRHARCRGAQRPPDRRRLGSAVAALRARARRERAVRRHRQLPTCPPARARGTRVGEERRRACRRTWSSQLARHCALAGLAGRGSTLVDSRR